MNCKIDVVSRFLSVKRTALPLRKMLRVVVLIAVVCGLGAGRAQAQTVIDYFNFNSTTTPLARSTTYGIQNDPTHSATTLTTGNFPTGNVLTGTNQGSTINLQSGDTTGTGNYDLTLNGGNTNTGDYVQLQTSTIGYSGINLLYAATRSNTGFTTQTLSYSTNGSTFIPFSPVVTATTSYKSASFDLSGVSTLQNMNTIYLRIAFTGATSTSGTGRIDNLTLTGNAVTPAPPGVVSAGIGFAVTGMGALLRRRKQFKAIAHAGATV